MECRKWGSGSFAIGQTAGRKTFQVVGYSLNVHSTMPLVCTVPGGGGNCWFKNLLEWPERASGECMGHHPAPSLWCGVEEGRAVHTFRGSLRSSSSLQLLTDGQWNRQTEFNRAAHLRLFDFFVLSNKALDSIPDIQPHSTLHSLITNVWPRRLLS